MVGNVTKKEFFRVLKEIRDNLMEVIQRPSSGIGGLRADPVNLDPVVLQLRDVNTELDSQSTTLSSLETLLGTINTSLLTQRNFGSAYSLVADWDILFLIGSLDIRIKCTGSQQIDIESISFIQTGGTNTLDVTQNHTSSSRQIKTFFTGSLASGFHLHLPYQNTGSMVVFSNGHFVLKSGHEIRIVLSGAALFDRLFVQIEGKAREDTIPTIDDTASVAVFTRTVTEHAINTENP